MTEEVKLSEQVQIVAKARQEATELKGRRDALLEDWNKANQELLDALTQAGAGVAEAETKLRELALKAYAETGNKSPSPGVGIREVTKLEYDPKQALTWAIEHKISLSLDKKSFEGFAKAMPLEFVNIHTEPQATIATDLSKIEEEK